MDVSAFGLAAGRKPTNGRPPLPSALLARNMNPRKANVWFGKSPRRTASLQYTTFVFCGCSTSLQVAKAISKCAPQKTCSLAWVRCWEWQGVLSHAHTASTCSLLARCIVLSAKSKKAVAISLACHASIRLNNRHIHMPLNTMRSFRETKPANSPPNKENSIMIDQIKHAQVMEKINLQIKRENERAAVRQKRFEQIQQRLKESQQQSREQANNAG